MRLPGSTSTFFLFSFQGTGNAPSLDCREVPSASGDLISKHENALSEVKAEQLITALGSTSLPPQKKKKRSCPPWDIVGPPEGHQEVRGVRGRHPLCMLGSRHPVCPCRTPWWFPLGKLPILNDPRLETKSAAAGLITLSQAWLPSLLTSSSQDEAICSCGFKGLICAGTWVSLPSSVDPLFQQSL